MGTILTRKGRGGAIHYTARVRKLGFPEQAATFTRRTDASDWIKQQETKIRQGLYLDQSQAQKHTLEEAIKRFIDDAAPARDRRKHLTRWTEKLGPYTLAAITDVALNEVLQDWKKTLKLQGSTLNRHLDSLSVALQHVKKIGWIRRNPVNDAERFQEPKGRVRFLSDEERRALLQACKKSDYRYLYFIVVLALSTGMRKEELLSIKWADVDVPRGIIILQKTKNKERRRVAVRGHAHELLREHAKVRRIDSDFLFPGEKNSPRKECHKIQMSDRHFDIKKPWERALREAKIKDFVFHDLRHSAASYLAMNGATLLEIAEVLGHKTLDVVQRYAHLAESHTASVVENMNRKIFGA